MKTEVFYWVLNMSIYGGLLCLAVLALRRVRWFPKGFVYALWALPFARLVSPLGLSGRYNLVSLLVSLGARRVQGDQVLSDWHGGVLNIYSGMNSVGWASSYAPFSLGSRGDNPMVTVMEWASAIWLLGATVCLLTAMALYCWTALDASHADSRGLYFTSERVRFPALYGILCPKIVIPEWVSRQNIPYIILHERVHMRRLDNLWRCAAVAVCCVHWFNPICWLSLRYFFTDMELSCDAAVLRTLPLD